MASDGFRWLLIRYAGSVLSTLTRSGVAAAELRGLDEARIGWALDCVHR